MVLKGKGCKGAVTQTHTEWHSYFSMTIAIRLCTVTLKMKASLCFKGRERDGFAKPLDQHDRQEAPHGKCHSSGMFFVGEGMTALFQLCSSSAVVTHPLLPTPIVGHTL